MTEEEMKSRAPKIVAMPKPALPCGAEVRRAHPVVGKNGQTACIICGGQNFAFGPGGRKSRSGKLPQCEGCQSLERHRLLRKLWAKLPESLLHASKILQFSPDQSVNEKWFGSYELSIYGGKNSINMESIARPNDTYDIIIANHVLEHVPDDRKAFSELMRVLAPDGFFEMMVPNPYFVPATNDWGYPRPENHEHFRIYGSDLVKRFQEGTPGTHVLRMTSLDDVTNIEDYVYFWAKNSSVIDKLRKWLVS